MTPPLLHPTPYTLHPAWPPLPPELSLTPHCVHICQTPTDLPPATLAHLTDLLSPAERQRLDRLRIPAKRTESLVARGLLRHVLGHLLQRDPRQLIFTTTPQGKPELAASPAPLLHSSPVPLPVPPAIYFNLSHTSNRVLLAVARDHPVGVDVEYVRPNLSHQELAQRFFTPAEHAAIISLPPLPAPDQLTAFFRCWTRKEAILKALGTGIAGGLDKFTVPVLPRSEPFQLPTPGLGPITTWTLYDLPLESPCLATLAIAGSPLQIHYWTMPPLK